MKELLNRSLLLGLMYLVACQPVPVSAEIETIDLKALAKKARPAVLLLIVSDASGKEIATGTGFLVSNNGKLITNHHVIENAASIVAKAETGGLFPIEGVLASDAKNDLVVLQLKGKDLPFLLLGNSDKIEIGTRIAVIGSPLGLEGTLSEGIISADRELMGAIHVIQLTAAISPGSSGSPVLNAKGVVVGIASSLLRGGQALNFAVPVDVASALIIKSDKARFAQPLGTNLAGSDTAIYKDPDWKASLRAEAAQNYAEALKHVQELTKRYPENNSAWFNMGYVYSNLGFNDDAIPAFRKAIKIMPDDFFAWYRLGISLWEVGRKDDAITAFRQVLKLKPDYAAAWFALGRYLQLLSHRDDAIVAFQEAIKLKPDDEITWKILGVCFEESGRKNDAIAAFRQAIKIKPNDDGAWNVLGNWTMELGRTEEALADFKQAIRLKTDNAEAWYNTGICFVKLGRTNEALDAFRQAVKLMPDDPSAWNNLGYCLQKLGQKDQARAAFRHADILKQQSAKH